jgi:hypothetical protein
MQRTGRWNEELQEDSVQAFVGDMRPGKAVALLNTSPRATHAPAQLSEILVTMGARLIPEASVTLAFPIRTSDGAGFVPNPELSRTLSLTLSALARAIHPNQKFWPRHSGSSVKLVRG